MSPVSGSRKQKYSVQKGPPGPDTVFNQVVRKFEPLADDSDPLDLEVFASHLMGAWWDPEVAPDEVDRFELGVIDYARRRISPGGRLLLRAMRSLGTSEAQREAAATALDRPGPEPEWAASVGKIAVGECWQLADVYGDGATLLCVFGYGRTKHGLVVVVDFDQPGGTVHDSLITDQPNAVLEDFRKDRRGTPELLTVDRIAPERARQVIEEAFTATEATWHPENTPDEVESFTEFRALALARARALPESDAPNAASPEFSEAQRAALVDDFLQASGDLPANEAVAEIARLIVDFGCDHDSGRPLRVGPIKSNVFLSEWLPDNVELTEEEITAVVPVTLAWVHWAAGHTELSQAATAHLVESTDEIAEHFEEEYRAAQDEVY